MMKKISFKILGLSTAAVVMLGSCNKIKDFGNTNVNPAATTNPIPSALLTNVESGLGGFATQVNGGYYCQYFAENQYAGVSLYSTPFIDFAGNYSGGLEGLQNIINYSSDPKTAATASNYGSINNQQAVARIIKSYTFWQMTDRWGAIPYSDALKGHTPTYDLQADIYKGLLADLKGAIAQVDAGNGPSGDIMYSGNMTKWKKLANSLRMLIALRMSKVYPSAGQLAATEFVAAENDVNGHITDNADNFQLNYPGGAYPNPWYNFYVISARQDYSPSKTLTDLLIALGDPRNNIYGSIANGTPYGLLLTAPPSPLDRVMNDAFRTENAPVFIVRASTVDFAKAEAAERGWTGESTLIAQGYYEAGITASFTQWGLSSAQAATYIAGSGNYLTAAGVASIGGASVPGSNALIGGGSTSVEKLKRIELQRYIGLYPDGAQGWAEWRRTGFPDVRPTVNSINSSHQIPRRNTYGQLEYTLNATGVAKGITDLTPPADTQDSHIWWDK